MPKNLDPEVQKLLIKYGIITAGVIISLYCARGAIFSAIDYYIFRQEAVNACTIHCKMNGGYQMYPDPWVKCLKKCLSDID